jgi:hypothetical protein
VIFAFKAPRRGILHVMALSITPSVTPRPRTSQFGAAPNPSSIESSRISEACSAVKQLVVTNGLVPVDEDRFIETCHRPGSKAISATAGAAAVRTRMAIGASFTGFPLGQTALD